MFCSIRCLASLALKIICLLLLPLFFFYKYLQVNRQTPSVLEVTHQKISRPSASAVKPVSRFAEPLNESVQSINDSLNKHLHTCGIDPEKLDSLRTQYAAAYTEDSNEVIASWKQVRPLLNNTLADELHFLCSYLGIANPPRLFSFKEDTYAFATDDALYLNPAKIRSLPFTAQLFVLTHELAHCIFKDDSLGFIAEMSVRTKHDSEDAQHPVNILRRLQEMRADQFALEKSPLHAFGAVQFSQFMFKSSGGEDTPGITHPKLSKRLKMATAAHAAWQNGQLQTA